VTIPAGLLHRSSLAYFCLRISAEGAAALSRTSEQGEMRGTEQVAITVDRRNKGQPAFPRVRSEMSAMSAMSEMSEMFRGAFRRTATSEALWPNDRPGLPWGLGTNVATANGRTESRG
jgi:hypothetical protein